MSNTPRNLNETCCKAQNYALMQSSKNLEKVVENALFLSHCVKRKVLRHIDVEYIGKKPNTSDKVKILLDRIQQFPGKYPFLISILKNYPTGKYGHIALAIETDKAEKEDSIAFQSLKEFVSEMSEILTGRRLNCHKYQSLTHLVSLLPDLIRNSKDLKNQKEAAVNTKEIFEQDSDKSKEVSEELKKLNQSQSERIQVLEEQEKELKQQIQMLENEVETMKQAKESEITNRDNWIKNISRKTCANCKHKFTGLDSYKETPERYDFKATGSDNHKLQMANDSQDQLPVHSQSSHRNAGTISRGDIEEDANAENCKLKGKQSSYCEEDSSELMVNQKIYTSNSFNVLQGIWQHEESDEAMDAPGNYNVSSIVTPGCSTPSLSVGDYTLSPSTSFYGIDGPRKEEVQIRGSRNVNIIKNVYYICGKN